MSPEGLTLEVVEGPDAGLKIPVLRPLVIGREADVDVRLNDGRASRHHARVSPSPAGAVVEDLGSANGTFVNHNQLVAPARLDPGDDLQIGVSVIQLRTPAQVSARPSAVRPVPPALAAPERPPAYVQPAHAEAAAPAGPPDLNRLLDVRVRAQARLAPLAVFLLAAFVLIIYFATR